MLRIIFIIDDFVCHFQVRSCCWHLKTSAETFQVESFKDMMDLLTNAACAVWQSKMLSQKSPQGKASKTNRSPRMCPVTRPVIDSVACSWQSCCLRHGDLGGNPKTQWRFVRKMGKITRKKGVTSPLNSHQRAQLKNGLPVQAAAPRNRRRGGVFSSGRCSGGSGAVPDSPRSGIWMNNERICQTFSKYYKLSIKHGVENWAICLSYHGLWGGQEIGFVNFFTFKCRFDWFICKRSKSLNYSFWKLWFFQPFQSKPIMHLLNFYIVGHCEGTVWGSMAPPKPKQAVSQMWGGQHTQKNKHT